MNGSSARTWLGRLEVILWRARHLVLLAVLSSLAMTLALLAVALADVATLLGETFHYVLEPGEDGRLRIVADAVRAVDGFLLATITLIFGIGLYDLFIRRIPQARAEGRGSRVLEIRSLDDLKSKLGKVIVLVLVVKMFETMLGFEVKETGELLMAGGAVLLLAVALYVSHAEGKRSFTDQTEE